MAALPPTLAALGEEKIVMLFKAHTAKGEPFYAYIHMTLNKFQEYTSDLKNCFSYDITTLGDIVAKGWGHTPPQEVIDKIAAQYGEIKESPTP